MMKPQDHKFPRLWRRIGLSAGEGITWMQWLEHENGGNMTPTQLIAFGEQDDHEIRSSLANLYRKFTDQIMASISTLGAP